MYEKENNTNINNIYNCNIDNSNNSIYKFEKVRG